MTHLHSAGTSPSLDDPSAPDAAMTLWVSLSGHRSIDEAKVAPVLSRVFSAIADTFAKVGQQPVMEGSGETVLEAHKALWPSTSVPQRLTLLTGYAGGADQLGVKIWQSNGFGRVHALFPYGDHAESDMFAWTDRPGAGATDTRISIPHPGDASLALDSVTVLDGTASSGERPARNPHLDHARWLVRWSDIAVAVWDGKLAAGTGGTADFVALALASQLPLIWIDVSSNPPDCRLIQPGVLWQDGSLSETVDALADKNDREAAAPRLDPSVLAQLLLRQFGPPAPQSAGDHGARAPSVRNVYATAVNRSAETIPVLAGRFAAAKHGMAQAWQLAYRSLGASLPAGTPYPKRHAASSPVIASAYAIANREANFLGDFHRACQISILLLAVLAVFVGSLPVLFPGLKIWAVGTEILLIVMAGRLLKHLDRKHFLPLWSDTRQLAEQLRALRAMWPLGIFISDERRDAPQTWMEWQVRAIRRSIGPPTGLMSRARRNHSMRVAREDPDGIVDGQRRYHHTTMCRMSRLHRLLHLIEYAMGTALLTSLAAFFVYYISHDSIGGPKPQAWIGNMLLVLSTVVPAIAAAALAVEAKIGVAEAVQRSLHLSKRFGEICEDMEHASSATRQEQLLREAGQLLISDVDIWGDAAVRRVAQQI